jgi:GT2 family glycosyltransferase
MRLYQSDFEIDHPLGACLIVRREAVAQVGVLDGGFFMYCEEIDWCLRLKRAGWQIWYVAAAIVLHHGAKSTGQFRYRMFVELHRSRRRFFAKHYGRAFCWSNRQLVRLGLAREMWRAWRARRRGSISGGEYAERMAAYRQVWQLK